MSTAAAQLLADDRRLLLSLRAGDEQAFVALVDRYHASLVRLAQTFVRDRLVAEEVAQETWLGVLKGVERFRGDSTLKTWIYRILTNRAKTRAVRERRMVPFSSLSLGDEPAVDPDRFLDDDHPDWPGHWASAPSSWAALPEEKLLSDETMARVRQAIDALPDAQRAVITLRDVEGFASHEVCGLLDLSEANQRVLLHRARSKVRAALESYLETA